MTRPGTWVTAASRCTFLFPPAFTHPVTSASRATSASHEMPCPAGRAGRTAATTCPSSSSLSCDSSPPRARPAACPALIYRAAVFTSTPARLAAGRLPAPASHARRTSLTCVTRTSRNAIPCRLFQSEMNREITAGWSINWQTRWSHPRGNNSQQVVPCSWQTTLESSWQSPGQPGRAGTPASPPRPPSWCWRLPTELASRPGQPSSHLAQKAPRSPPTQIRPRISRRWSARRIDRATIVKVGLEAP